CEACHTAEGWDTLRDPLAFDHDGDTGFPLLGRHRQAACRSCHFDLRFDRPDLTPDACASCHLDVHQGQLGADCQQCHTTQDFHLVKGLEIHAGTAFPLTGSHLQVACEACHAERSEEHTSELQSRENLVCRLLLEKKKKKSSWLQQNHSNTDTHTHAVICR